jgi:uncharacterized membrane protein YbhN (UPF0104 family)
MKMISIFIFLIMIITGVMFIVLAYEKRDKMIKELILYADYSCLILVLYYFLKLLHLNKNNLALFIATVLYGIIMIVCGILLLYCVLYLNLQF